MPRDASKDEIGRRVFAALMSYQLGLKSIDRTLKVHIGEKPINPMWGELGWALLVMMNRGVIEKLLGPFVKTLTDTIQ